jgi:Dockerin type I domain
MNKSKIEPLEPRLFLSTTLPTPINEGDWSNGYKLNVNAPVGGASLATYSFSVQQNERVAIAVKPSHGKSVSVTLLNSNDDAANSPSAKNLSGVVHLGTYTIVVSDPNSVGYRLITRATPVLSPVTFFSTFGSGRFIAGGTTLDTTTPSLGDFSGKHNLLFTSSTDVTADYAFTVDRDERVTIRLQSPQKKNLKLEAINADSVQPTGDLKWTDHQSAFVTAGTYFISVSSLNLQLPAGFQIQFQLAPVKAKSFRAALTLPAVALSSNGGAAGSSNPSSTTVGSGAAIIASPPTTDNGDSGDDTITTGNSFNSQTNSGYSTIGTVTYCGDANLSGVVDGADYSLIDNSYNSANTAWQTGDFNYDGHVDGSDYSLIDNAFTMQTGSALAAVTSSPIMTYDGDGSTLSIAPTAPSNG